MKRRWNILLLATVAVAGWSAEERTPETMRGATVRERSTPLAKLVVGVNEPVGSVAEPGWPLIVSALILPEGSAATVSPSDLKVTVTDERKNAVPVAFELVPRPAGLVDGQSFYWLATETATRELAPGLYHVRLAPNRGELTGLKVESADLRVVAPSAERRNLLSVLKIQRSLLLTKEDDALAEANRAIASDAKDQHAWIAKGDILMLKDLPDEALEAYDNALELHKKAEGEPMALMQRRRAAFSRSLEKRGVTSPQAAPK